MIETIKVLGSTKTKLTKNENDEHYLSSINTLSYCKQQLSLVQLLDISPKHVTFLKTFNSEFSYIEVWFTDQNSKPLQIKDKINITLVIK